MRKIGCILGALAVTAFAISGALAATESKDDGIRSKVAGKSITRTNKKNQTYTTTYKEDGTTFSKSTKLDGSCCTTSPGNWWVDGTKICETYKNWGNGGTWCHEP